MAIVSGLALLLSDYYIPPSGKVVLLFQPAEETGAGAQKMVTSENPVMRSLIESPESSIFALHNVPGFPKGTVVLPNGNSFASASRGMHIKLQGATSHASQPHLGKNPAMAMCNIIQGLLAMPTMYIPYDQKALVTIVGAKAGEKAFGVSAGDAEIMATLRATTDIALESLISHGTSIVNGLASTYGLTASISYEDEFAATINNPKYIEIVRQASKERQMATFSMGEAFPWSEDFGIFLQKIKGAMFGLGMGETHQPLHGEFYDFTDSEIENGVSIFATIISQVLGNAHA
jgi:amidohydrolase